MRKLFIVMAVALMAALGLVAAPAAQAQDYPSVRDVTQFTQSANYMSLPGYLRYAYFLQSGRWISREEAENAVRDQLGTVPEASAGDVDGMEGDAATDEGTGDTMEGDAATDEGATDEGATDEGTTDEGTTDEGATDEGATDGEGTM